MTLRFNEMAIRNNYITRFNWPATIVDIFNNETQSGLMPVHYLCIQ